jgi:hypothetical protein
MLRSILMLAVLIGAVVFPAFAHTDVGQALHFRDRSSSKRD